jgi:hypothetical protein
MARTTTPASSAALISNIDINNNYQSIKKEQQAAVA